MDSVWMIRSFVHCIRYCVVVVFAGLRLNNAWASGTVLRPFLQPESPLSSQSLVSGFKCKLRDSNSRPPYSRPRALTTRLCTIHTIQIMCFRCFWSALSLDMSFAVKFYITNENDGRYVSLCWVKSHSLTTIVWHRQWLSLCTFEIKK